MFYILYYNIIVMWQRYCKQAKAAAEIGCIDAAAPNLVPEILVMKVAKPVCLQETSKIWSFKSQSLVLQNVIQAKSLDMCF